MSEHEELVERLAALEHEQWVEWSQAIAANEQITPGRLSRWRDYWVAYEELPDDVQEADRERARRVLAVLDEVGVEYPEAP